MVSGPPRLVQRLDLPQRATPGGDPATNARLLTEQFRALADRRDGWTGADGTYSLQLPDGRTLWSFGDTFIGGVRADGSREDPSSDAHGDTFVRTTAMVQDGSELKTLVGDLPARQRHIAEFVTPSDLPGGWYWPGGAVVHPDGVQQVLNRYVTQEHPGVFGWSQRGSDVVTYDPETLAVRDVHAGTRSDTIWGAAILQRPDHTYIYGARDAPGRTGSRLKVARTAPGDLRGPWEYLDADGSWSSDERKAAEQPVAVANQFSVVDAVDGVRLLTHGAFDETVHVLTADSPIGPFRTLAEHRLPVLPPGQFSYGALVHPQFSRGDDLVVSYNVSELGEAILRDYRTYVPRFTTVRVPGIGGASTPDDRNHHVQA